MSGSGDRLRIVDADALRAWLTGALEPICDADPSALAKYVMALIKKDKPQSELHQFCLDQLDVFLTQETRAFVDKVFAAVKSNSYLPAQSSSSNSAASNSTSAETSLSTSSDSRPRSRSPPRRRRSPPPRTRSSRSRSPRSRSPRPGARNGREKEGREKERREKDRRRRSPSQPHSPPPPPPPPGSDTASAHLSAALEERRKAKRKRCRDYDERGYCMQGDRCPFDHGPDPVVVEDNQLPGMIAVKRSNNYSQPPPGYPASSASGNAPLPPGVDFLPPPSSASQPPPIEAYNPEAPSLHPQGLAKPPHEAPKAAANFAYPPPTSTGPPWAGPNPAIPPPHVLPPPPPSSHPFPPMGTAYPHPRPGFPMAQPSPNYPPPTQPPPAFQAPPPTHPRLPRGPRPHSQGPPIWDNKTLEIRKVPPQLNSIVKLNEHFQQFGQIINIQVRFNGDPEAALITFATRPQAVNAYKSTAPILNNRFIRVFWHQPKREGEEDQDPKGQVPQQKPPPVRLPDPRSLKKVNKTEAEGGGGGEGEIEENQVQIPPNVLGPNRPSPAAFNRQEAIQKRQVKRKEKEQRLALMALHRKKSSLLSNHLSQQKTLMAAMEKVQDNPVKMKEYASLFKTVEAASKKLAQEVSELTEKIKAVGTARSAKEEGGGRTKEAVEKEKLDVELELVSQEKDGKNTAPLREKLSELKAELLGLAAEGNLGEDLIPTSTAPRRRKASNSEAGGSGGKRQRSLMMSDKKLDKRPRNVLVSGFAESRRAEVEAYMESFGEVARKESAGPGALHIFYKTRQQAETALELGEDMEGKEAEFSVAWGPLPSNHAPPPPPPAAETVAAASTPPSIHAAPAELSSSDSPGGVVAQRHMSAEEMLKSIDPYDSDSDDDGHAR